MTPRRLLGNFERPSGLSKFSKPHQTPTGQLGGMGAMPPLEIDFRRI